MDAEAIADVHGDAEFLYRRARLDPDDAAAPSLLCRRLLGTAPRPAPIKTEATLAIVHGRPGIWYRRGTPPARLRWLVCHELAEWWYRERDYRGEDIEERCDALGAALVAPPRFVRRALTITHDVHELARLLETTQSLALLRMGEVGHAPVALLEHRRVVTRGPTFEWGTERSLRAALRDDHPMIQRVFITDERRRVGAIAA